MQVTEKRRDRYIYGGKACFYTKKANPTVRECVVQYVVGCEYTGRGNSVHC